MAISQQARTVIERPLDESRVKTRQGGQNMNFKYIPTEYAIQLLNEAFDYAWDSRVFHQEHMDTCVIVGVELKVWDDQGNPIIKQQFGSCNINRGVDVGSAFKGAASDGLKKCASQFGLALELYLDEPAATNFRPPQRPAPSQGPVAPPAPPRAPVAPPRPPADRETRVAPPAGPGSGPPQPPAPPRPATPPAPPAPPASRPNPFAGNSAGTTASVPKPPAPTPPAPPRTAAAAGAPAPPRPNPFGGNNTEKGINSTQMAALTSLSTKKGLSQPDLIALAQVADAQGMPKQSFEELSHAEAIQVIKAAQQ